MTIHEIRLFMIIHKIRLIKSTHQIKLFTIIHEIRLIKSSNELKSITNRHGFKCICISDDEFNTRHNGSNINGTYYSVYMKIQTL